MEYILQNVHKDGKTHYIIIDEVQLADDFVELLLSLMHQRNLEVFVSGSNSKFLSKDVVTEFRGRGQEIRVWPLSFKEYYSAIGGERRLAWQEYYVFGGLPQVLLLETEEEEGEEEVEVVVEEEEVVVVEEVGEECRGGREQGVPGRVRRRKWRRKWRRKRVTGSQKFPNL